jgi:hypothetical protein
LALVAALTGVLVGAVSLAGTAVALPGARSHSSRSLLRLGTVTRDQAQVLRTGILRVRVTARRPVRLRVYAVSLSSSTPGSGIVITGTRTVKVRPRRPRRIVLRLIAAGRSELTACLGRTIEVRAVVLSGAKRRATSLYWARRRLSGGPRRPGIRNCPRVALTSGHSLLSGAAGSGLNPLHGGANNPITNPDQGYGKCDPIDGAVCLQPWPNDYFTVSDSTTDSGRRVNLDITSTPANKAGKPFDPADINRNDGYSPGSPIVTKVPGMDTPQAFARTGAVPITDMARTYDANQPVVVLNTRTLQRQLIWTEIDSNPTDPTNVNLIIRPAANLQENTRYIVALRDMRDGAGNILPASPAFRTYRDRIPSPDSAAEGRRAHFEALFNTLAAAGIDRQNLYLAWDFTVASERSLSERQLAIRNDAYAQLGDTNLTDLQAQGHAPAFSVTKVTNFSSTPGAPNFDPNRARQVEGTFTVPCYLNLPGCPPGSRFLYAPGETHGSPTWIPGNMMTAHFTCNIPWVALANGGARPALYGHGLFGTREEVNQGQALNMIQEHNFVYCATEWVGMACSDVSSPPGPPTSPPKDQDQAQQEAQQFFNSLVTYGQDPNRQNTPNCDIPNALSAEADLSNFPSLVDRVDQAFVNFMYLGRLLILPNGFSKDPSFQNANGSVIDTRRLFYDGNSQGGIFGGSLIALEPDLDRGVVGVPGMNYAVLLQRSSDFGTGQPPSPSNPIPQYAYPLYQSYPNELQRQLILSLIQQMWDHSDPNGLAAHMTTDPLPNTPPHHVLMQAGLGDHQVSNYAAETEARTIGAHARLPWADPGRYTERDPTYGIAPITHYPYDGSAITLWDTGPIRNAPCGPDEQKPPCGTDPPPTTNTAPAKGWDPHEFPRRSAAARQEKSEFLQIGGLVTNTCGSRPCYAGSWTGP